MDQEPLPEPSGPSAPAVSAAPEFAGFWVRGGAHFVDTLILALCYFLPFQGLSLLVALAYKTIFVYQGGQTPGKMAAGLKVVAVSGEPIGVGRALARAASEYLSAVTLCIGYAVAGLADKRALHDYVCGTRVVYVEGVGRGRRAAFAFLGVLGILVPIVAGLALASLGVGGFEKFKSLKAKAGEGATKGSLGLLRSSSSIYYGDAEGVYPAALEALVDPKYLLEIPKTKLADHPETAVWTAYGAEVCTGKKEYGMEIDASKIKDTGGWGYVNDPQAVCWGQIFVDCTHPDSKGKPWPEY